MARYGSVLYGYGMIQYGQTIYTVKYGTVMVRCQGLEIAHFLQVTVILALKIQTL